MWRALEEQTSIPEWFQRGSNAQVIEARSRMGLESPVAVEDQNLASPTGVPICFRIEIEDMGCQLASCIAMRRHRTTLPRVIPFERGDECSRTQHLAKERLVHLALKFRDEFLPRLRHLQARVVVQQVALVRGLPVGAFNADLSVEP